jgi:hypothetical protein
LQSTANHQSLLNLASTPNLMIKASPIDIGRRPLTIIILRRAVLGGGISPVTLCSKSYLIRLGPVYLGDFLDLTTKDRTPGDISLQESMVVESAQISLYNVSYIAAFATSKSSKPRSTVARDWYQHPVGDCSLKISMMFR